MFNTILVEVTGLKKEEQQDYVTPGNVKVTYTVDMKSPASTGLFYGFFRFANADDAPRIGDKFEMTLTPLAKPTVAPKPVAVHGTHDVAAV